MKEIKVDKYNKVDLRQLIQMKTEYEVMINSLKREIDIKNRYCQLIIDLGFDYDGFNTVESLKGLIDTLVDYAYKAKESNDKSPVYENAEEKPLNILMEEVSNE